MTTIQLIWCGQRIPTDTDTVPVIDAIEALGLDQVCAESLHALWCATNAFANDKDGFVEWFFITSCACCADPVLKMAGLIADGAFQEEATNDSGFDWSALPDWVRQNADSLKMIPA